MRISILPVKAQEMLKDFRDRHHQTLAELELSQKRHEDTLSHFKEKHNNAMTVIAGKINETLTQSHQHVAKTEEQLSSLIPLLRSRSEEIEKYKEGFHQQMVGPLLNTFFKIRDDIRADLKTSNGSIDAEAKERLEYYDSEIAHAITELGLEEIVIREGQSMSEIESRFWSDLGVAQATDDPAKHRTCAQVLRSGYILKVASGEPPHVVRKARVKQYAVSSV